MWFLLPAKSQGQTITLNFSRIILVTSTTQTVPVGYIWKIENILPNERLADANTLWKDDGTVSNTNLDKIIIVNGQNIIVHSSTATTKVQKQLASTTTDIRSSNDGYGFASGILSGPIWLPEGTTLAASTGVYAISVIEFKIIP
ncbi:MAG TPA: hypothetical protein P5250_03005 [Bacteroidales bacterium]|nr:hypothetical protein [Bacteroidales bacterium]